MKQTPAALRVRFARHVGDERLGRAAFSLFLYASAPALLAGAAFAALLLLLRPELDVLALRGGGPHPFTVLVVGPVVGTLVLGTLVLFFARRQPTRHAIALAALVLAAFHALDNAAWGVTALAMLLVHGHAFVRLYDADRQRAFVVPMLAHALHNGVLLGLASVL